MSGAVAPAGKPARKVLFIHQNFPGQFKRLAVRLAADPAYSVLSIGKHGCPTVEGVRTFGYRLHRGPAASTHHYARPYESGILHGQAVMRLLLKLKAKGYAPDVIVAHPGWGETLFVKDVFPSVRLVHFSEYYYQGHGADVGFDPEFPATLDSYARLRAKNGLQLLNLEHCDAAVSPTQWQKSLHPAPYQDKIRVVHEGIDTDYMCPDRAASFTLPDGTVLRPGDPVVTYVARNLEPYRGFHVFMRALPQILARHPRCQVVICGGDETSYGSGPADGGTWKARMLAEVAIDSARVHFVGKIPFAQYRSLLQVSAAHVYLTYPFVLSWSMLEAMACGCLMVASDTAPVREVIVDGDNGMLVDFFDIDALAAKVVNALNHGADFAGMRTRARATAVARYGVEQGIASYRELIDGRDPMQDKQDSRGSGRLPDNHTD